MKKKFIAAVLALTLTLSMSFTAMAASSTTSDNSSSGSSSQEETSTPAPSRPAAATPSNPKPVAAVVAETKAGAAIRPAAIQVAVASPNGTVSAITLDKVVATKQQEVAQAVASIAAIAANITPASSAAEQTQAHLETTSHLRVW